MAITKPFNARPNWGFESANVGTGTSGGIILHCLGIHCFNVQQDNLIVHFVCGYLYFTHTTFFHQNS